MVGLVDMGEEASITAPQKSEKLATHILQILYLGIDGTRWPVAHYSSATASASEIDLIFWQIIGELKKFGFNILYTIMDGASTNRKFLKSNFWGEDPLTKK